MQAAIQRGVYEVLARIAPGDLLCHIGNVNAPEDDLARVYALKIYDEEDWCEVWVVPREEILVARPDPHSPFSSERDSDPSRSDDR